MEISMQPKILFLFALFYVESTFAEAIHCEAISRQGDIKEINSIRSSINDGYEPQWFDTSVKMRGLFSKNARYSLEPLYFKENKMTLMEFEGSTSRSKLLMNFTNVNKLNLGTQRVEVILNKGSKDELKQNMNCSSDGPVQFIDYCSSSKFGTPLETLLYASKVRNSNIVDMVASCNLNVNKKDEVGCTPLMYAVDAKCGKDQFDIFSDFAPNIRIINTLISAGAYSDLPDPATEATPLIKSALVGDIEAMTAFLEMEADLDAQDKDGYTAIMRSVAKDDIKGVELLLKYNPNLELINNEGLTAGAIAKMKGYMNIELALQKPEMTLTFVGIDSGKCTVNLDNLNVDKLVLIEIKSTNNKMFLLSIPELSIGLMSEGGKTNSIRFKPNKVGSYNYSCGFHGDANPSKGVIIIK
jgi:hypothetical protein